MAGWRLGKRTIDTLTDTAPPGIAAQITSLATLVPGVVGVERVRARQVGRDIFVELTATVSRTLPIDRVNAIKGEVARAITSRDTWSGLATSWPVDGGDERLDVELAGLPAYDRDRK